MGFLKNSGFQPLIRKQGIGIFLETNDSDSKNLLELLRHCNISYYVLTKDERIKLILTYLLQYEGYTTMDALSEEARVSRGTISADLKHIKKWLSVRNIELISSTNKGVISKLTPFAKIPGERKQIVNNLFC